MTPPRLQPGDWLTPDYSITDRITATAQTTLYRAKNANKSGQYAIKVFEFDAHAPSLTESIATFKQVAMQLERMDNEHVPTLHEHGQLDDHTCYMVFEHIEGKPLSDALVDGPISPAGVKTIIKQILAALQEAHDLGLVHQNITPNTIMLVKNGIAEYDIALLDLGTRAIQIHSTTPHTTDDPRYLAPECLHGTNIGPACDLYALGLMTYEMLVGKHPLDGLNQQEMLASLQHDASHQLPDHTMAPALLQVITDRLLQKDLSRRYQSATEVLQDFRAKSSTRNTSFVNSDMIKKMLDAQAEDQNEEDAIIDAREAYQSNDAVYFREPLSSPVQTPDPQETWDDAPPVEVPIETTVEPKTKASQPTTQTKTQPPKKEAPPPMSRTTTHELSTPQKKDTKPKMFIFLGVLVVLGIIAFVATRMLI